MFSALLALGIFFSLISSLSIVLSFFSNLGLFILIDIVFSTFSSVFPTFGFLFFLGGNLNRRLFIEFITFQCSQRVFISFDFFLFEQFFFTERRTNNYEFFEFIRYYRGFFNDFSTLNFVFGWLNLLCFLKNERKYSALIILAISKVISIGY